MYIKNGIAYAGEQTQPLKISGVFDFSKELNSPAFSPLKDKAIFNSVYIDYGVTVWNDGDIDIAPEYLYKNGVSVGGPSIVG